MPSNLLPSLATSLPSTVPVTPMFPVTCTPVPPTTNVAVPALVVVMSPLFDTATFDVPFAIVVLSIAVVEAVVIKP